MLILSAEGKAPILPLLTVPSFLYFQLFKMGYDVERFSPQNVDEELICTICRGVLEDPLQFPSCEHAFCASCIHGWLHRQLSCPIDRNHVTALQLKPVPRILKNLLSKLLISCENQSFGCTANVRLDGLQSHLVTCEFNPKRPVPCHQGCGLVVAFDEMKEHNCVRELNNIIQSQKGKLTELQTQMDEQRQQLNEQKREIYNLKEVVRSLSVMNTPHNLQTSLIPSLATPSNHDTDIHQWLTRLQPARVTRWGGMISTPDAVLQAVIRRCLADSGCPPSILNELMENAHERKWPTGLSTLETRQLNRRRYEQFVSKRIPGKQAVVIMACENEHMGESMSVEPGLVMIFAHGIEAE